MSNEYLEYIKKHRLDFIKLSNKQNSTLARLYIETAGNIKAQAESIIDKKTLSYAQAKIRVNSLLIEADRLSNGFEGVLNQSLIDAADLGKEADKIMMRKYQTSLADNGIKTDLMRILQKVNPEAVKAVFDRIWTDGLKLSDRIWLLKRRTKQEIERIVMQNVISGGSASNKATLSALENLFNPNYKAIYDKSGKIIGNKLKTLTSLHGRRVGYESSRLLRTSMSEAFNEGARLSNLKNPGSTGMKLLNASGPCEVCAALDLLPVEQTGLPPIHPNCRCTTLEDVQSVEDFTDRYIKFMDDPSSDKQLGDWVLNVYDKGGAKTLTSMPAVKDVIPKVIKSEAKTIKEAEDWAKQHYAYDANLSGLGNVKNANEFNTAFSALTNEYGIKIDRVFTYSNESEWTSIMKGKSFSSAIIKNGEMTGKFEQLGDIGINKNFFTKFNTPEKFKTLMDIQADDGWSLSRNIKDLVTHEYGHIIYKQGINPLDLAKEGIRGVSKYAETSMSESVAELFLKYKQTGSLPTEQMSILSKFLMVD